MGLYDGPCNSILLMDPSGDLASGGTLAGQSSLASSLMARVSELTCARSTASLATCLKISLPFC